jgi:hypothetical protein
MATISRVLLSGSTNGKNIKVVATATPGTTIHTALAGTTGFDEVYCWVTNTSATPVPLTVEFGGVASPDDHLVDTYQIPANSAPIPIVQGQNLQNGLLVKMFAGTANVLVVSGYCNRIQ